jgi:DMSO/TMAO reductase YedYZ molybdopterin-dependent catalytic subunit
LLYIFGVFDLKKGTRRNKMNKMLLTLTLVVIILVAVCILFIALKAAMFENSEPSLAVDGSVQHPLDLTIDEIAAMPKTTVNATLYCVGAPDSPVENGNWTGVQLAFLLENVGVSPDAIKIAFYAEDGYTTDLTIAEAEQENIILAYEKDGNPLPETLRLVVPGRWGYKWISQVNRIELVNYDFKGFYESNGYSDTAEVS